MIIGFYLNLSFIDGVLRTCSVSELGNKLKPNKITEASKKFLHDLQKRAQSLILPRVSAN